MRAAAVVLLGMGIGMAGVRSQAQTASLPLWAYGYISAPANPGDYSTKCTGANPGDCGRGTLPSDPANTPRRLAGSDRTFTLAEINAPYGPADWFPDDHPPMPPIVAHGKEAIGARACAMCHLPNGHGLMQNGPVAGLPVDYFLRQIADFKSGKRRSGDLNKANGYEMQAIARNLTDDEARAAAEYFGAIPFKPWVRVVESETVPVFTATVNGLFLKAEGNATEPLGRRLVEMPESTHDTNILRSTRSGFVVYAPIGSVQKGEALAKTCVACHGADMRGTRLAPPIAGRQASYLARQMWDMKIGARNGDAAKVMKPSVEKMTEEDLIAITAYVSSRQP
jgi:cytochrome c553